MERSRNIDPGFYAPSTGRNIDPGFYAPARNGRGLPPNGPPNGRKLPSIKLPLQISRFAPKFPQNNEPPRGVSRKNRKSRKSRKNRRN